MARINAMQPLGNGLYQAGHFEAASSVKEAELSMCRRVGASEDDMLVTQGNLATYEALGRSEQAVRMRRDVYSGHLKLDGEEHEITCIAANNYADTLVNLERFEEAKSLSRKIVPVTRRVFGEGHRVTLITRKIYAKALYMDTGATLDDLREAVATMEDVERIARRVLGGAHPLTTANEGALRRARAALARAPPPPPSPSGDV